LEIPTVPDRRSSDRTSSATASRSGLRPRLLLAVAALLLAGTLAPVVVAAPEPDPIPRRWQLDLDPGELRTASVDVDGLGPQAYFYMTYKVTNASGGDLLLAPSMELATDEGEVLRAGRDVPASVTREILARLENPFLQDQTAIVGVILQGEENAREGLAIWPATDLDLSEVTVFAAGFSGETAPVDFTDAQTGKPGRVLLRKSLMLRYNTMGELHPTSTAPLTLAERLWVMR